MTICPARVPVSVAFCPENSSATANSVLAMVAPSSGIEQEVRVADVGDVAVCGSGLKHRSRHDEDRGVDEQRRHERDSRIDGRVADGLLLALERIAVHRASARSTSADTGCAASRSRRGCRSRCTASPGCGGFPPAARDRLPAPADRACAIHSSTAKQPAIPRISVEHDGLDVTESAVLQVEHEKHIGRGQAHTPEKRDSEQQLQRNGGAEHLGKIAGGNGDFADDPEHEGGAPANSESRHACARSRPLAMPSRADSDCSRIAMKFDSMMTLSSVYPNLAPPAMSVAQLPGIHVADGDQVARPGEREHLFPGRPADRDRERCRGPREGCAGPRRAQQCSAAWRRLLHELRRQSYNDKSCRLNRFAAASGSCSSAASRIQTFPSSCVRWLASSIWAGSRFRTARQHRIARAGRRNWRSICEASASSCPRWVGIDQEGGRVARLRSPFTEWPPMAVLGRSDDPALAGEFAGALAAELCRGGHLARLRARARHPHKSKESGHRRSCARREARDRRQARPRDHRRASARGRRGLRQTFSRPWRHSDRFAPRAADRRASARSAAGGRVRPVQGGHRGAAWRSS